MSADLDGQASRTVTGRELPLSGRKRPLRRSTCLLPISSMLLGIAMLLVALGTLAAQDRSGTIRINGGSMTVALLANPQRDSNNLPPTPRHSLPSTAIWARAQRFTFLMSDGR